MRYLFKIGFWKWNLVFFDVDIDNDIKTITLFVFIKNEKKEEQ